MKRSFHEEKQGQANAPPTSYLNASLKQEVHNKYTKAFDSHLKANRIYEPPTLRKGLVIFSNPMLRVYYVATENGGPVKECLYLMRGSGNILGVYDASTISVNTKVWYIDDPSSRYGIIIGAEPKYNINPTTAINEIICQESEIGPLHQNVYRLLTPQFNNNRRTALADYSGRTPEDSTEVGEHTLISESGSAIHLDPFMAMIRASDISGVWCFYIDSLTRVSGQHLELWSGVSEFRAHSDFHYSFIYEGVAQNVAEQAGLPTKMQTQARLQEVLKIDSARKRKPLHYDKRFSGSLFNGDRRLMIAVGDQQWKYGETKNVKGLSDFYRCKFGQIGIKSATGIHLVKSPHIRFVEEKAVGGFDESVENYNPKSFRYEILQAETAVPKPFVIHDIHAFLFDYLPNNYPSSNNKRFYVNDNNRSQSTSGPSLSGFSQNYNLLQEPSYETVTVGSNEKIRVYKNNSYISMTADGSIVLGDGYGATITMTRGKIQIDAPLGIDFISGRNFIVHAGRDVILRAKNCVDVSTTEGSIRNISGANFYVRAAHKKKNSGIVLEADSTADPGDSTPGIGDAAFYPGINLKSSNACIAIQSKSVFLNGTRGILEYADSGNIVRAGNNLIDVSKEYVHQIFGNLSGSGDSSSSGSGSGPDGGSGSGSGSGSEECTPVSSTSNIQCNTFSASGNYLGHDLFVRGKIVGGSTGHFKCKVKCDDASTANNANSEKSNLETNARTAKNAAEDLLEDNQTLLEDMSITFRNSEQYKSSGYTIIAPRWKDWGTSEWKEDGLWSTTDSTASITYPFPGEAAFDGSVQPIIWVNPRFSDKYGNVTTTIDNIGNTNYSVQLQRSNMHKFKIVG